MTTPLQSGRVDIACDKILECHEDLHEEVHQVSRGCRTTQCTEYSVPQSSDAALMSSPPHSLTKKQTLMSLIDDINDITDINDIIDINDVTV